MKSRWLAGIWVTSLAMLLALSSTDANVPIGLGIPGITIDGGGTGGGAHGLDEWYDDGAEGWKGPQWATLLVLSLAGAK